MNYYDTNDGGRLGFKQIVKRYNMSLPPGSTSLDIDLLKARGVVTLKTAEKPEINDYQSLEPGEVVYNEGDDYATETWKVVEVFVDEVDQDGNVIKTRDELLAESKAAEAAAEKARLEQEVAEEKARQERLTQELLEFNTEKRNQMLNQSDRFVLPDFPHSSEEIKNAWLTFRQELRDITTHENWPDLEEADWPVAPTS